MRRETLFQGLLADNRWHGAETGLHRLPRPRDGTSPSRGTTGRGELQRIWEMTASAPSDSVSGAAS